MPRGPFTRFCGSGEHVDINFVVYMHVFYMHVWCLFRCEDAADMNDLEQSNVESIANDIEEKLYNLHQDINPKYKNKYRSLVFNLKDTKNQVSFVCV